MIQNPRTWREEVVRKKMMEQSEPGLFLEKHRSEVYSGFYLGSKIYWGRFRFSFVRQVEAK